MFFHCWPGMIHPSFSETFWAGSGHTVSHHQAESSLYHLIATQPEGPFTLPNKEHFVVKGSRESGLYGTSIFHTQEGETALTGWYVRNHTLEVSGRFRLRWSRDGVPEVADTRYHGDFDSYGAGSKEQRAPARL